MRIKSILLKNFRNYEELEIPFHEDINLIFGQNGQGKTNLLEGISILSMGKSFRTTKDAEMISFGKDYFRVKGVFSKKDREDFSIEIAIGRREKRFVVDGIKKDRNSDLLENVYIVVFSPEDLRIVKGEPEKRRKFLDREICQIRPSYFKNLSKYKKVLMQRNFFLKGEDIDLNMLDVWDEHLVYYGNLIMQERSEFIEKLSLISKKIHSMITNGKESLEVFYDRYIDCDFKEKLLENRENDISRKVTSCGPHKDDLKLRIGDIDIRNFGSQGQQRTAALSLKLAEIAIIKELTGEDAIILLDDVLSELDRERQSFLLKSFHGNQLFISAAEIGEEVMGSLPHRSVCKIEVAAPGQVVVR